MIAWRKRLLVEGLRIRTRTGGVVAGVLIVKHFGVLVFVLYNVRTKSI